MGHLRNLWHRYARIVRKRTVTGTHTHTHTHTHICSGISRLEDALDKNDARISAVVMNYGIWTHTYCGPTMVVSSCVQTSDIVREICAAVVSPEHSTIDVLGP